MHDEAGCASTANSALGISSSCSQTVTTRELRVPPGCPASALETHIDYMSNFCHARTLSIPANNVASVPHW